MIAAVRRWAAFLRVVHGRRPLTIRQRAPALFGDARLDFPNHYPVRAGLIPELHND